MIYYLQVGDLLKIGHSGTTDTPRRSPGDRLIATEPGDTTLHRQRHMQFRDHRDGDGDGYQPAPEVIQHLNHLRAKAGAPAIRRFV
ncbi:hypothetical protein ACQPXB_35980 [Amycolatopsis sp. CA-161197]|uniref:hypothetical protein n=1 Tax=Amycolatopsis sp. CA-161197 TaxID=3239922 RepID=UPI003D8DC931